MCMPIVIGHVIGQASPHRFNCIPSLILAPMVVQVPPSTHDGWPAHTRAFLRRAQTHTTFCLRCQHAGLECCYHCHRRLCRWCWSSRARDKSDNNDAGKQQCRCHPSSPSPFFPSLFFFFLDTSCSLSCCYRDTAKVLISWLAPRTPHLPVFPDLQLCRHAVPRPLFRMASSPSGLQVPVLVQHLSWQLISPAVLLGCLSSQGPLGLVLGFYHAQVQCLDIAHFNHKASWGQPSMAGVLSGHTPPGSPEFSMISPTPHVSTNTI
jgi:hypothetical protein